MKIFIQVPQGDKYELEVNEHTSIEEARDNLIKQYGEFPKIHQNQDKNSKEPTIVYKFIYHGKYLYNPDPFSTLKAGSRVILYIKKIPTKSNEEEEEEEEEEEDLENIVNGLENAVNEVMNVTLLDSLYNEQNSFWTNPSELNSIESLFNSENSDAFNVIASTFLREHYPAAFRHSDVDIGTILNMIGSGPLVSFGHDTDERIDFNRDFFNNSIYMRYQEDKKRDNDITIQQFTTKQTESYNKVLDSLNEGHDIEKETISAETVHVILDMIQKNDFDVEKTVNDFHSWRQSQT